MLRESKKGEPFDTLQTSTFIETAGKIATNTARLFDTEMNETFLCTLKAGYVPRDQLQVQQKEALKTQQMRMPKYGYWKTVEV